MYTKVIQSGTLIEEWEYERVPAAPEPNKRSKRRKSLYRHERRSDAITRCRESFRRLVRANLVGSLSSNPALVTLTMREVVDVAVAYRLYTLFTKRLRTAFGEELKWIAVPEFQKRGAVHFHVLVWGLPDGLACKLSSLYYLSHGKKRRKHVCPPDRQCERNTRRLAGLWGEGFADAIETDGNVRISTYLSKYMSKAMHDERLIGKRAYSASRNVLRPVHFTTPYQIAYVREDCSLGVDNPPDRIREYDTMYLGRCVYKSYSLEI